MSTEEKETTNERTDKRTPESGAHIVCQGATCQCNQGAAIVKLKITSQNKAYIHGKYVVATVKDITFETPAAPFRTCKLNPAYSKQCLYSPSAEWMWTPDVGNQHPEVNGLKVLTENARLLCPKFGGEITFVTHGQQIEISEGEVDESAAEPGSYAISCLFDTVDTTPPATRPRTPARMGVKSISLQGTSSGKVAGGKVVGIDLRQGVEYTFSAALSAKPGVEDNFVYWYVCPQAGDEQSPTYDKESGVVYKQLGSTFGIRFDAPGGYFIEGFRMLQNKKSIDKSCAFLLRVHEKNRLVSLAPDGAATRTGEHKFELWKDKPCRFTLNFLFAELTEAEKASLHITLVNASDLPLMESVGRAPEAFPFDASIPGFLFDRTVNESAATLKVEFLEEKYLYSLVVTGNRVDKIIVVGLTRNLVRPGTRVRFEAVLKNGNDARRLSWRLDGVELVRNADPDPRFMERTLENKGNRKASASIRQLFGETKVQSCTVLVDDHRVNKVTATRTTYSAGETATLSALTNFESFEESYREFLVWEVKAPEGGECIRGKYEYMVRSRHREHDEGRISYLPEHGKSLELELNRVGKYEVKALINGTPACAPLILTVGKAHIEEWTFYDGEGIRRNRIGWGQAFHLYFRVRGWAGRRVKVHMWWDTGKREGDYRSFFKPIEVAELSAGQLLQSDGSCQVMAGTPSFWQALEGLDTVGFFRKRDTAVFFTVSGVDTLCDNWKARTYEELEGHVFPQETVHTYLYIACQTYYSGLFADNSGGEIKQIIARGAPAWAQGRICNSKEMSLADYLFRIDLFENLKGDDELVAQQGDLKANAEGVVKMQIDTHKLGESRDPAKKHRPRFFYFRLYGQKSGSGSWKLLLTCPADYALGKANDGNLIELQKHDWKAEDMGGAPAYYSLPPLSLRFCVADSSVHPWTPQQMEQREAEEEERRRQQAETRNRRAEQENEKALRDNRNYFLQLKIAEEPQAQRSIYSHTAVKIGEALEDGRVRKDVATGCPRCKAAIRGTKAEIKSEHEAALEDIFPLAGKDALKTVADTYTKHMSLLGLDTCWIKAHFFAQVAVETGYKLDIKAGENMNYGTDRMLDIFPSRFFKGRKTDSGWISNVDPKAAHRHTDNRVFKSKAAKDKAEEIRRMAVSQERNKVIANYVYADANGATLGNTQEGDGWRFRGSGLIQLTGRSNFQAIQGRIQHIHAESLLTDAGADKVRTNLELATLTSMGYFIDRDIPPLANGHNKVDPISKKVGERADDNVEKKAGFFKEKSAVLFRTEDCRWLPVLEETDVITYHIVAQRRVIVKKHPLKNANPDKRKYIYYDRENNKHFIGEFNVTRIAKIIQIINKKSNEYPEPDENGKVEMIYIKEFGGYSSSDGSVKAAIGLWDSNQFHRWYINPECFAGLLGAMLDLNIDFLAFRGSSTQTGAAGGSKTHINGVATDIAYFRKDKKTDQVLLHQEQLDLQLNVDFINALIDYGYKQKKDFFTEPFTPYGETEKRYLVNGMGKCEDPPHNNHLHIGGFDFTTIIDR